jgi:hypothetical protein
MTAGDEDDHEHEHERAVIVASRRRWAWSGPTARTPGRIMLAPICLPQSFS